MPSWFSQQFANLKLSSKFALILLPLLLSIGLLFAKFLIQESQLIESTRQELVGVQQIPQLLKLMDSIQRHRGLSQIARRGDGTVSPQLQQAASSVQQIIENLNGSMPVEWSESRSKLKEVSQEWARLLADAANLNLEQNFERHSELVQIVIQLIRYSADDSQMTFDPEPAPFYLISALNFDLPVLQEQVALLRGKLAAYATLGDQKSTLMIQARTRLSILNTSAANLQHSYEKVTAAGFPLDQQVMKHLDQFKIDMGELERLIDKLEADVKVASGPEVFSQLTGYLGNIEQLSNLSLLPLRLSLDQRIQREQGYVNQALMVAAVVALLVGGILWFSIRKMTADTRVVLAQAECLSSRDLRPRSILDSGDEMGIVSRSIENIRAAQMAAVQEMAVLAKGLMQNTSSLTDATSQITQSATDQSDASSTVASAIEELSVSVSQVSQQCTVADNLATKTGSAAEEGMGLVKHARSTMEDIGAASQSLGQTMNALGERSSGISSIIQTIQEIAEQTNLLALNAAIEAARAGEQGKGFAVVADEVRKLSERTAASTRDIAQLVTAIQSDTRAAIDDVGSWKDRIAGGVELSVSTERQMEQIGKDSSSTESAIQEINQALSEQSEASQMIARQVEKIAQMTEETQSASQSVSQVAGEVKSMSEQLTAFVQKYQIA